MAAASIDPLRINIKTLNPHATHEVEVLPTDHVSDLKSKLEVITSIALDRQRLLYLGRALTDDSQTLEAAGIQDGHTLHMVERPVPAPGQQPTGQRSSRTVPGVENDHQGFGLDPGMPDQMMSQVLNSIFHAVSGNTTGFTIGPTEGAAVGPSVLGIGPDGMPTMISTQQGFSIPIMAAGRQDEDAGARPRGRQAAVPAEPPRPLLTTVQAFVERLASTSETRSSLRPLMSSPSTVLPEARRIDNERRWFSAAQQVLAEVDLQPQTRSWIETAVSEALSALPPSPTSGATASATAQQSAEGGTGRTAPGNSGGAAGGSSGGSGRAGDQNRAPSGQQPWEANPSNPQVASVVAAAVGHIMQRSQEVWTMGPQPALERAAQQLQTLTGPVPRGNSRPPHPAVDAVSSAGRHLYAFGALAWELARLCRMLAPALQGQVQLQLAMGRPAFISPDGTSPMMPFATGRAGRGSIAPPGVHDPNHIAVRLPNGVFPTSNPEASSSPEEFVAGLSTALGGLFNNHPHLQPQVQSQQHPMRDGAGAAPSAPLQQQQQGEGRGIAFSAGPSSAQRGTQTEGGTAAGGAPLRPSWQTVEGMTWQPSGSGGGIPTVSPQLFPMPGFMAPDAHPHAPMMGPPGMGSWLFDDSDGEVPPLEDLHPAPFPAGGTGGTASAAAAAAMAQAQLRAMITAVVAPAVQQALASSGLLGDTQTPEDDHSDADTPLPDNLPQTLGSSIAEALQPSLPMLHDFVRQVRALMTTDAAAAGGRGPYTAAPFQALQEWLHRSQQSQAEMTFETATSSSADGSSSSSSDSDTRGTQQPRNPGPEPHDSASTPEADAAVAAARQRLASFPLDSLPDSPTSRPGEVVAGGRSGDAGRDASAAITRIPDAVEASAGSQSASAASPAVGDTVPKPQTLPNTHGPSLARPGAQPVLPPRPGLGRQGASAPPCRRQPCTAAAAAAVATPSQQAIDTGDIQAALPRVEASRRGQSAREAEPPAGLSQIMAQMGPMMQQLMGGAEARAPGDTPSGGQAEGGGDRGQSLAGMMGPLMQQMGPMLSQMMGGGGGGGDGGEAPLTPSGIAGGAGGATLMGGGMAGGGGGLAAMMQQMASSPAMQQMAAQLAGGLNPGQAGDGNTGGGHREPPTDAAAPPNPLPPVSGTGRTAARHSNEQLGFNTLSSESEAAIRAALQPQVAAIWLDRLRSDAGSIGRVGVRQLSDAYLAGRLNSSHDRAGPYGRGGSGTVLPPLSAATERSTGVTGIVIDDLD